MAFLADLFGGKSGVRAANQAAEAASSYTNTGYGSYRDNVGKGYDSADSTLQGYENALGGQDAARLYGGATGARGQQGYQDAFANYQSNPFYAGMQGAADRAVRNTFRQYNSRGMGNSGAAGAAVGRVADDTAFRNYGDWMNRLQGNAQMGGQYGQMRAQNAIGRGNAMGESYVNQNNALANIESQRVMNGQQARQSGMNNLLSGLGFLGGAAISGFAPGAGGTSAFGNMRNALSGNGFR